MKFLKAIIAAACTHCGGTGWIGGQIVCPACNGSGQQ